MKRDLLEKYSDFVDWVFFQLGELKIKSYMIITDLIRKKKK